MNRPAIGYVLERPWTAGMFLRLWVAHVVFAAAWWALRASDAAIGLSRHPLALAVSVAVAAAGFVSYRLRVGLYCPSEHFAVLDLRAISGAAEVFANETGNAPVRL